MPVALPAFLPPFEGTATRDGEDFGKLGPVLAGPGEIAFTIIHIGNERTECRGHSREVVKT
jgi:hypothetical protein